MGGRGGISLEPIEVYGPYAFSGVQFLSACFVLVEMFGAENLPAVGGIWHVDPNNHICRVPSRVSLQQSESAF